MCCITSSDVTKSWHFSQTCWDVIISLKIIYTVTTTSRSIAKRCFMRRGQSPRTRHPLTSKFLPEMQQRHQRHHLVDGCPHERSHGFRNEAITVPLSKLQWLLHCALQRHPCWSRAGWWWWWLELPVVAASCSNLCWCWSWPLHLTPWPLTQILHLCTWGFHPLQLVLVVLFIQPLTQIFHLHTWWYHTRQFVLEVFSLQPLAQILHLQLSNLHCVVVVCALGIHNIHIMYYVIYIVQ